MRLCCAIYEHAARLPGASPWAVSRSADLLFRAHAEAFRCYRHSPVVVGIDLYHVEAEASGAVVGDGGAESVPKLMVSPCSTVEELASLPALDLRAGRLPRVLEAARNVRSACPEADVRVPVTGPFTLAAMLLGLEPLLEALALEPDAVERALNHLAVRQRVWCEAITCIGLNPVVFESAASPPMVSPAMARQVILPALAVLLADIRTLSGAGAMLIQGGDTAGLADPLGALPVDHLICPAETDQAAFLAGMAAHPAVTVRVNMAAGVIADPDWAVVRRELDRVAALAATRPGACLGTGIVPYATQKEQILQAINYVAGLP